MLCYEILRRNDAAYVGMIGSKSKKGVLENWLAKHGVKNVDQVKIPIGKTFFQSEDKPPEIISTHIISEMLFSIHQLLTFIVFVQVPVDTRSWQVFAE